MAAAVRIETAVQRVTVKVKKSTAARPPRASKGDKGEPAGNIIRRRWSSFGKSNGEKGDTSRRSVLAAVVICLLPLARRST